MRETIQRRLGNRRFCDGAVGLGAPCSGRSQPAAFVLAADGATQQTLEQAGILNVTDGRKYGIILGKALFWDIQAGSDGMACASCHFHAGADARLTNQLHPGFLDVTKNNGAGDTAFGSERSDTGVVNLGNMPSNTVAGPNYTLTAADMPLHKLQDETNRNSPIITTTNDRVSSLGAFDNLFSRVGPQGRQDTCQLASATFSVGGKAVRQVEPRNTPSVINAVFNHRNFWDGRANNLFNGVGVFGMRDINGNPNKRLIILDAAGKPQLGYLKVEDASLASQAVGPPLSDLEMSCDGRTFPHLGRKMLTTKPLAYQQVSATDSVLGPYINKISGLGLKSNYNYVELIKKTFPKKYWGDTNKYKIVNGVLTKDPNGFTQMETNFSMFWGIAIMLYESTLVSDQSEFDTLQAAGDLRMSPAFGGGGNCTVGTGSSVDELLLRGCKIFSRTAGPKADGIRGGNCFICHNAVGGGVGRQPQPLLSENSHQAGEPFPLFLTVTDVNGKRDLRDQGFANIGLRPVFTDLMSGRTDPYGNPLSFGRQLWNSLDGVPNAVQDPVLQRAITAGGLPTRISSCLSPTPANTFCKLEVDGSSKAPILRNVVLTPPYFIWGGYPSLRQQLKVYNRAMNRRDITAGNASTERAAGTNCTTGDTSGSGPDGNQPYPLTGTSDCNTNTTGVIVALGLADCEAPSGTAPRFECDSRSLTSTTDDLAALERFLKSLSDPRVQCDQSPFDHPSLPLPTGHSATDANNDGKLDDITFTLPAVGAAGYAPSSGFCISNSGDLFAAGMQGRSGGR